MKLDTLGSNLLPSSMMEVHVVADVRAVVVLVVVLDAILLIVLVNELWIYLSFYFAV